MEPQMTNDEMKAGRFLKLAKGRKLMARMNAAWDRNGIVRIGTATRYTDFKAKHRDMIRLTKSGSIYTQSGKSWLCADFCSFQFSA
jgi:hypothetical protein